MADVIDVENALTALIAQVLYPNGTGQPSVAGIAIKVYAGWPTESQLDSDLRAGTAHVTVFPTASERNTSRYPKTWETLTIKAPTLTLTQNGQQVTIGGAMPAPFSAHNLALLINGKNYTYAIQQTDTLASIATALASVVAVDFPGTSSAGAVITLSNSAHLQGGKIGTTGTSIKEIRRQDKVFQITVWCDTPAHRDAVSQPVDAALASTPRISLSDGSNARVLYQRTLVNDGAQKAKLYRRDFLYSVEYATTQTETDTQIVASLSNFSNQPTGATAPISTATVNL